MHFVTQIWVRGTMRSISYYCTIVDQLSTIIAWFCSKNAGSMLAWMITITGSFLLPMLQQCSYRELDMIMNKVLTEWQLCLRGKVSAFCTPLHTLTYLCYLITLTHPVETRQATTISAEQLNVIYSYLYHSELKL